MAYYLELCMLPHIILLKYHIIVFFFVVVDIFYWNPDNNFLEELGRYPQFTSLQRKHLCKEVNITVYLLFFNWLQCSSEASL